MINANQEVKNQESREILMNYLRDERRPILTISDTCFAVNIFAFAFHLDSWFLYLDS